ncbi:MAG: InlB B-repeat-containing protein [Clostridia bacterium]|nr:InlB B-repeat-containing protein [Clostridia bacterium]
MKKRIVSLVLAALVMLASIPITVVADDSDIDADINDMYTTRFAVDTVNLDDDAETVQVNIKLTSNSGFAGLAYRLEYDTAALTLESQPVSSFADGFVFGPIDNENGWHMGQLSMIENVYDTGVLLTYTFKVNSEAVSGFYEVKFVTSGIAENGVELGVLDENAFSVINDSGSGGVVIPGYKIYYNANGGTGAPESQYKSKNASVYISPVVPVRNGYKFLGWATSSTATQAQYQAGTSTYSQNADLTLYAVWEEHENVAGSIDVSVSTVGAKPGSEIEVAISIANHPGFGGMDFDVVYDNTKLDYISYEQKMAFSGIVEASDPDRYENKVNFQILAMDNVSLTGELVTLKFKVLDGTTDGLAEISVVPYDFFKYDESNNYAEATLEPNVTGGGVNVVNQLLGDINLDETVNSDDAILLLQHLMFEDLYQIQYVGSLDFNGDDVENPNDAIRLLQHVMFEDLYPLEQ